MTAAQLRIFSLAPFAVWILVAAAYLHAAGVPLHAPWQSPAGLLVGLVAAVCVVCALYLITHRTTRDARATLDRLADAVLEPDANPPADAHAAAVVQRIRDHVSELRTQVEQLHVQRKSLEIQLRLADAERRQSEALISGIADAVLVTNGFDELMLANPAASDMFNFKLEEAPRTPIAEILGDSRLVHDIRDLRQSHARANRRAFELVLPVHNQPRHFAVTMNPVTDSAGQPYGVVTVLHDTTREHEVARMKSEFVSHVSHELRTPLSSIKAYVELLVDGEATDEKTRAEFYQIIQSETDRLSRLIDNILNISRIEAGITRVNKKPVSLTGILKEVLEVALPPAKEKNITLVDQIAPSFFQIDADRDMIYQASLNLVSNAIKYTPPGGTVKVSVDVDESTSQARVNVADTGVGIPPEAMAHLFEKFYRVEQNKAMAKGTGLGLNLTRQIIETVHKGKIHVSSEVGKGSTFGFELPIVQ